MNILETCQVNDVISVVYGDTPTPRIVRVIDVRDLNKYPLSPKTLDRRPNLQRGTRLVTCQGQEGQIRAFYAGVEQSAQPVGKLLAAILFLRGKLPHKVAT